MCRRVRVPAARRFLSTESGAHQPRDLIRLVRHRDTRGFFVLTADSADDHFWLRNQLEIPRKLVRTKIRYIVKWSC